MAELLTIATTGVIKSLLSKLTQLLGEEYNLLVEVRSEVEFLQRDLLSMDAMLRGLLAKEKLGHAAKELRTKWQEMAYHIEDGIDMFMQGLGCAADKAGFMRGAAKDLNLKVRHQIARQIQGLKARVVEESGRDMRYQLPAAGSAEISAAMDGGEHASGSAAGQKIDPRVMALYADADHQLVGMDGPVERIVELLTLGEDEAAQQLQIVSILGAGGLGKTTLANQVYRKIKGQFDYTVLVSVSRTPNFMEILRKIAPVAVSGGGGGGSSDLCQLTADAKNYLRDKRYLIIFDDIWNKDTCKLLQSILPENNKKSRVITTTRIADVASSCCSKSNDAVYPMKPLSDPHSKELFLQRTFRPNRTCPEGLDEVANKILKKCGGIPLAIITIASLLAEKPKTKKEWKRVHSSIGNAHELRGMRKTLLLSFDDLSYDLRNCLLSLSMFPEDCEVDRERLVLRWIAEGFVSGKDEQETEKIGQEYFNELINRCLIQPIDIQYNGSARACRVHDLMLELILALSKEENFVTILDELQHPSIPNTIRWLSFHCNEDAVTKVTKDNDMSHVRSLSFFPPVTQLPPFMDFRALRVLDVKGCHFVEHQRLKKLATLIQLMYLNLSDTNVTELPKEIGDLQYLETLDLRNSRIKSLPATLSQLRKLVRLFVSPGVILPDKIGKMQALQELSHVAILCNSLKLVEQLGELAKLRVLRIDCHYSWLEGKKQVSRPSRKHEDTLLSSLRNLGRNNLQSLEIDLADDSLVLSLMDSCCALPQLEELVISNFISRVPWSMRSLEDLSHLEIKLNRMDEKDLQILRDMSSSLLFLKIHLARIPEERLVVKGFDCLKQFEFCCDGMGLKFAPGAMPDLEKLHLDIGVRTTMSKFGGFDFGIKNLEALKHVSVKLDCRAAESREIQAAEIAISSGLLPRRLMPQIQRIGR